MISLRKQQIHLLKKTGRVTPKHISEAQRNIDIAKERGQNMKQILSHDLLPITPLFDGDLPTDPKKALLVSKIEADLQPADWKANNHLPTHAVIDVMAKLRQMPFQEFSTIGTLLNGLIDLAIGLCKDANYIHFVLDSYIELSLKEGERLKRSKVSPIDIIDMSPDTPTPHQEDKFWASEKNKQNLQIILRELIQKREQRNPVLIASSMIHEEHLLPAISSYQEEIPALNRWIEEADSQMIVHIEWA